MAAAAKPGHATYWLGLAALIAALALAVPLSLSLGSSQIPLDRLVSALLAYDGATDHLTVVTVRLPRVLAGLVCGAALAVSGAIMQAVTGNPLASPGLLGVNAGAAFAVVLALVLGLAGTGSVLVWYGFGGGILAALAVYSFASMGTDGPTPLKVVLAGAILSSFLVSVTTAALIFNQRAFDEVRLWTAGSLAGRGIDDVVAVLPYLAPLLSLALLSGRQLSTLSLGHDVARALGQQVGRWRFVTSLIAVGLAASAVAIGGPIGFVGLVVPHAVRFMVGVDYRRILPFAALGGGLLVVVADALSRWLLAGRDMPVGIVMAIIGAPFFIYLAASRSRVAR